MAQPLAATAAAAGTSPSQPGFFSHHGLMAVGVRLLRAVNFRLKLLLVLAVCAVPISFLGYFYFQATSDQVEFTSQERLGVRYVRDILPAIRATQDHRGLANRMLNGDAAAQQALAEAAQRWQQAFSQLAATDQQLGEALRTSEALKKLQARQADLQRGQAAHVRASRWSDRTSCAAGRSVRPSSCRWSAARSSRPRASAALHCSMQRCVPRGLRTS